jgi:hypothetical protein
MTPRRASDNRQIACPHSTTSIAKAAERDRYELIRFVRKKAKLIIYARFFEPKPEEQPNLAPAVALPKLTS